MADENQTSALFRRHEQLKRWHESDTNKCADLPSGKAKKVKFQDGCVFLAACSSGDREEVKRLLDRGADINTANIDGLTALHQACIDDNLDMVEFLVENNADVDVCDNEGWTPLHATASCGFTEIARYLLRNNANVAAVNNDGDLPYDICEDDEMEKLLQDAMDEQGVDADAARREEEEQMMADANSWLNNKFVEEEKHPKTGATALHVAAAKGYDKVINVLLQAAVDINAKDNDGWTALHAAAHWGQEEACKILAENMCDMEAKNLAGQTAFDVADTETIKLLEELKLKQASLKDQQKDSQKEIIQTKLPSSRRSRNDPARSSWSEYYVGSMKPFSIARRSSVTRMSVEQKHNVMKISEPERLALDSKISEKEEEKIKSSSSSASEEETSESETEKKNEINKQTSDLNKPRDRDKPPIMTTVEIKDTPNDYSEVFNFGNSQLTNENEVIGDILEKDEGVKKKNKSDNEKEEEEREKEKLKKEIIIEEKKEEKTDENENKENKENVKKEMEKEIDTTKEIIIKDSLKEKDNLKDLKEKDKENIDDKEKNKQLIENVVPPKKEKAPIERTISAPPTVTEVPTTVIPKISINAKPARDGEIEIPSWRSGLRKTGSTSTVLDKINEDDRNLPRSASSPRLTEENKKNEQNDKPQPRRPFLSSSSFSTADTNNSSISDRYGGTQQSQGITNPYRYHSGTNPSSNYHSSYIPYYKLQQIKNEEKERAEKEKAEREKKEKEKVTEPPPVTSPKVEKKEKEKTSDENTRNWASSSIELRRKELPPSSRISLPVTSATTTTGSTVSTTSTSPTTTITTPTSSFVHFRKSYEPPKRDEETEMLRKKRAKRARETRRSTQGVTLEEVKQASEELRKSDISTDKSKDSEEQKPSTQDRSLTDISESVVDGNTSSVKDRTSGTSDSGLSRTSSTDISSTVSSWRRSREEREENSRKDDDVRGSFRRGRDLKDLSSSLPSSSFYSDTSTYIPRAQRTDRTERNALSAYEPENTSLSSSGNLTRSASLRTPRIRNDEIEDSSIDFRRHRDKDKDKALKEEDKTEKDEKRPESSAMRTRRMRRERRSTGIANVTAENDEDKDKENKEEEKKSDKSESDDKSSSSRFDRYGSASDVPSHLGERTTRPSSFADYSSRSAPSLDKDYKKLYEEEKSEKERLKRDLEQCKKELREAKLELDRQLKRNDANRVSETNDKRERRALERKLSELEEEIKKMDQLKEDNRRLREENGALIRVISKLSK